MEAIGQLADRYGFDVIEDASHAIGGVIKTILLDLVLIAK